MDFSPGRAGEPDRRGPAGADPSRALDGAARVFRRMDAGRPLHVVHVLHSFGRGGTENGVVNLLNRADPARFRFTLALMQPERALLERMERPGVRVVTVRRRWGNDPLYPAALFALFRRDRPDVVHTRNFSCIEGLAAARLAGVRGVLHSEHGRDVDEAHALKRRRALVRSVLFRCADRVVTVSEELRATLLAQVAVSATKVACVPNGVDLARFGARGGRERVRRELGFAEDEVVIGSVGRHDPVKDYGSLLAAFAGLGSAVRTRLVLCGGGPETADLRARAAALGVGERVTFTGFRDDVPDVLAALDVFALPSVTEGMSNALLEAMAAGLPCVATAVGGNAELVAEGETGLLVPASHPAALRQALAALVTDAAARTLMGRAARRRAEERHSLAAMVARYEAIYEELAGRRGTAAQSGAGAPRPADVRARPELVGAA